jgi:hypothetical protein
MEHLAAWRYDSHDRPGRLDRTELTGADFGKLIAEDTEKWAKVVKFSGAKPD